MAAIFLQPEPEAVGNQPDVATDTIVFFIFKTWASKEYVFETVPRSLATKKKEITLKKFCYERLYKSSHNDYSLLRFTRQRT